MNYDFDEMKKEETVEESTENATTEVATTDSEKKEIDIHVKLEEYTISVSLYVMLCEFARVASSIASSFKEENGLPTCIRVAGKTLEFVHDNVTDSEYRDALDEFSSMMFEGIMEMARNIPIFFRNHDKWIEPVCCVPDVFVNDKDSVRIYDLLYVISLINIIKDILEVEYKMIPHELEESVGKFICDADYVTKSYAGYFVFLKEGLRYMYEETVKPEGDENNTEE